MRTMSALCIAALIGAFVFPQSAQAETKITMKGATVAPPNTPWSEFLKRYKKIVRKGSDKGIKVKLYLGGTKGDEASLVRQVRKNDLQFAGLSAGAMSVVVPELDLFELPYLFDSYAEADHVLDVVRPQVEALLEAKGFKLVMYSENGYRCFGTNKPIRKPADLKAIKMRSQESPSHLAMYKALNASARPISVGEVLPSLNTGNVEGFDNTALFTQAASWHQAITHFTVSEHIYQPAVLVVNKGWYDALSPELQAAIMPKSRIKEEARGRKGIRALTPLLLENFKQASVKVYALTADEKATFKAATRPAWDARLKVATPKGKALFKAILEAKKSVP